MGWRRHPPRDDRPWWWPDLFGCLPWGVLSLALLAVLVVRIAL